MGSYKQIDTKVSQGKGSSEYDGPAPPYDDATTINIIVTGECQQGKSTLIRQLSQYAGAEDTSIGIGDGNKACTMDVGSYEMDIKLRSFQLVDASGKPVHKSSYSDLVALEPEDAKVIEVPNPNAPTVRFRFVDTPGLNDTQGEDFSIMSRILGRAVNLGHVNALIYHLQGLIVVHSCFAVDRVEEFLEENERLDEIRRNAFQAATQLELEHFFMDNSPDPSSPFAVVQSLNEIYRLLTHLSSQKPLPVHNMKLLKTDAMRHLDIHVINDLKTLEHHQNKEHNREKVNAEVLSLNTSTAQRQALKLRAKIAARQSQLAALKTKDEILLGKKSCVSHYSFVGDLLFQGKLNLGSQQLTYDSDYPITSVSKTCSPGSKWLSEELRGTSWRGEIYGNLFRDINGTATFYTTSELKHKEEIEMLKSVISDLQDQLAAQEETLARNTGGGPGGRLVELGEIIDRIEAVTERIQRDDFEVTLWPAVRGFYTMHTFPTAEDIKNFVMQFDEKVGQLL